MNKLSILLVEDDPFDAELVERALESGGLQFKLRQVSDRDSYLTALELERPALVLSDFALPQFDGLSALRLLKARYADVPFILVSGAIGEDRAVAAMREGAADYLLKDRLSRLPGAVASALEQARLFREKRVLEERLLRADRLESLGRLAAGVAHDLNNFILPILVASGLLRDSVTQQSQLELLDTIETSALRSAKLLKQLLSFGRGSSGDRVPVRLDSAIADMRVFLRDTFPKTVTINVDAVAEDVFVLADPTQVTQVLMNLCVNARDAMPDGGVLTIGLDLSEIDLETAQNHPGSQPGLHAVLSVKDTGIGIPQAHLSNIFDPFFTTKDVDKGTGLGLSSVLGIVEAHGGFIQVESTLGSGSEFRVHFRAHADGAAEKRARPPLSPRPRADFLLLVDDEPAILQVLGSSVRRRGYRVLEANDGVRALELLAQHAGEVAVVVSDLAMPRLDGLGLVRAMRERGMNQRVVVMTGAITREQVESFHALGVHEVLRKPFRADSFLDSLGRVLAVERDGHGSGE